MIVQEPIQVICETILEFIDELSNKYFVKDVTCYLYKTYFFTGYRLGLS